MRSKTVRSNLHRGFTALALLTGANAVCIQAYGQTDTAHPGVADQAPQLSAAQRAAIYSAVDQEKSKVRPPLAFSPMIGAKVPPSIALYALPDSTLTDIPSIRQYQYTVVQNQVVLVDPTTLQVVDIIKP
jgi:hypothetical protein